MGPLTRRVFQLSWDGGGSKKANYPKQRMGEKMDQNLWFYGVLLFDQSFVGLSVRSANKAANGGFTGCIIQF